MATTSQFVNEMQQYLNYPYDSGGTNPHTGFDCSGLVQYALSQIGITAPRTSEQQWAWVTKISASQLQPGSLVFAQFPGDNASPGHVGVFVGNGQVLSAEDPQLGVGYASLASWKGHIYGYGQVPGINGTGAVTSSDVTTSDASLIPGWLQGILGLVPGGAGANEAGVILDPSNWVDWAERGALMLFGGILMLVGLWKLTSHGDNESNIVLTPQELGSGGAATTGEAAEATAGEAVGEAAEVAGVAAIAAA